MQPPRYHESLKEKVLKTVVMSPCASLNPKLKAPSVSGIRAITHTSFSSENESKDNMYKVKTIFTTGEYLQRGIKKQTHGSKFGNPRQRRQKCLRPQLRSRYVRHKCLLAALRFLAEESVSLSTALITLAPRDFTKGASQ